MNSRRLIPNMETPPPQPVYRSLNVPQEGREVLGADLNCSEFSWGWRPLRACKPMIAHEGGAGDRCVTERSIRLMTAPVKLDHAPQATRRLCLNTANTRKNPSVGDRYGR
jgi:hypothetical protein